MSGKDRVFPDTRHPPRDGRLAYVCHIFPHLTQTFVYWEVEELRRAGLRLTVFSMKRPEIAALSEESRHLVADAVYLPSVLSAATLVSQIAWLFQAPARYLRCLAMVSRGRYRYDNGPRLWLHGIVDFARGAHLARLVVRDARFCHLHAQFADDACTTTLVASMLARVPFSFRSHTSPNPQLIREKVRQAQFVVSASLYDKRVLVHWCGERAGRKIHVNHLGVPLDRYAPAAEEEPLIQAEISSPPREARPLILSVGTLCAKKGFEYLIRACRVLADRGVPFDCLIVGDGPDRRRLEELVEELELEGQLTLAPYRPQEEVRQLFREAAASALPCIFPLDGNVDVIPLVLQEAMAMERPVVSTPISGIPELIQHDKNGLLVPEKDHEALAAALEALLADTELSRRLGVAGRQTVQSHFDVAANGRALAEVFRCEVPALVGVEGRVSEVGPTKQKAGPSLSAATSDTRHPTSGRHDLGR